VVVVFVQVFPEAKRRQFRQVLDAYEAAQREKVRAGSDQAADDGGAQPRGSGSAQRLVLAGSGLGLLGVGAWWAMYRSGVHATIAGVAFGFAVPARPIQGRSLLELLGGRLHLVSAYRWCRCSRWSTPVWP
jgi:Na+/H+ antiporter 1